LGEDSLGDALLRAWDAAIRCILSIIFLSPTKLIY